MKDSEADTPSLKRLLDSPKLEFIMEAHNGLSARIAEDTGFAGIWASGLSISAALGVRDCNEASWTQVLDVTEFMRDAAPKTPILLDGDTGFGNFNNVRRLIRKMEQRGLNGVCIEDKIFPKRNSFIKGSQPLADTEEFCGKIRAAKDTQTDPEFCVVARTEGFISGLPLDAVLSRAESYYEAGADAILVHSKQKDASEILSFAKDWDRPCPLVIVPTTYGDTPSSVFAEAGISLVIWANHSMRASITAIEETCRMIHKQKSISAIEERVAPLSEVFRLQRAEELSAAESKYLPDSPPAESLESTDLPQPIERVLSDDL